MNSQTVPALLSVVIPVYNEELGVDYLAERLNKLRQQWSEYTLEFVLVDDGSSDRTPAELQRVFGSDPSCVILLHGQNRGVGAAFRTGFEKARGEIICTIDADCSYGPENLRLMVNRLKELSADIAVASPYHPDGDVEGVPRWRLALSRVCSLLYRICSPVKLYTYTSVFRAYRRAVVSAVPFEEDGFVSAAEILIRAAAKGFTIIEVPMILRGRKIGHSKMKVVRTIRQHLRLIGRLLSLRFDAGERRPAVGGTRTGY